MSEREDIARELGGIEATLKAINESTAGIRKDFSEYREKVDEAFEKQSARISVLEGWRWKVTGIAIGAALVVKYLF